MPSAQRSVVINRPPGEVFDFFTNPINESRWRTHLKEVSASGPVGVGSRVHQVVKGPGGRGIPADIEVTVYQPPERYAFRVVAGPVRPTGEYRFAGVGDTTTVSLSLEAQMSGLKKLLMSRAVQKSMDGEMRALSRAKALLENT
ncbi:MAG TPA: SRPBCC family protein [Nocardioides sp.]|jgi:uncharacterized protein YndB with AHSA1/START domain|nr:SRPBCC family protein [Nocardioides sp.]